MAHERGEDKLVEQILDRIKTQRHFDFREYKRATRGAVLIFEDITKQAMLENAKASQKKK